MTLDRLATFLEPRPAPYPDVCDACGNAAHFSSGRTFYQATIECDTGPVHWLAVLCETCQAKEAKERGSVPILKEIAIASEAFYLATIRP